MFLQPLAFVVQAFTFHKYTTIYIKNKHASIAQIKKVMQKWRNALLSIKVT